MQGPEHGARTKFIVNLGATMLDELRNMNLREFLSKVVNLMCYVVGAAFIIWKVLVLVTNCDSPVVVVLTGSMEPAFLKGDLLLLVNTPREKEPYVAGDILVFKIQKKEIPIVHRITRVHNKLDKKFDIRTKGDNNPSDDYYGGIYARNQKWLAQDDLVGRAKALLPLVGYVTILFNEHPSFKFIAIGVLALLVLLNKE